MRSTGSVTPAEVSGTFVGSCEQEAKFGIKFQVTDVKKPLVSVSRICEKGNWVCFGPGEEDNFIQSIGSGEKIHMRRKGRSFVVDGTFGDEWQQLTIDSAAEENVCPKGWGQKQFGTSPVEENKKIKFVAANGNSIDHYDERKVTLNTKSTF